MHFQLSEKCRFSSLDDTSSVMYTVSNCGDVIHYFGDSSGYVAIALQSCNVDKLTCYLILVAKVTKWSC